MRTYKLVAHRGASAYEPENTLRSIRRAIDLGADMVEVDIRSTVDRQLVVIHDSTVDRTTNGKGRVEEMTLRDIRKLDAGKGDRIPILQEVLELTKETTGLLLEIKGTGIEKPLVDLLRQEHVLGQVVVTSFMSDAILRVKELEPRISTGQIFGRNTINVVEKARQLGTSYTLPEHTLVTRDMTRQLHEVYILTFAWTVDDPRLAKRLVADGVDGIITDLPDLMPG